MNIKDFLAKIGAVVVAIAVVILLGVVFGFVIMLLWNWLMPTIFGITTITYWQGFGLWILCDLLFKSNATPTNDSKK